MHILPMKRHSGILLHVSSLPSGFGIGDFGNDARRFVDFLADTQQKFWQILPLTPTETIFCNSPYSSPSAFAGNTLLISPQMLLEDGLLARADLNSATDFAKHKVNYAKVANFKKEILDKAYRNFTAQKILEREFQQFCQKNNGWLDDFALFVVCKKKYPKGTWNQWPSDIRDRKREAILKIQRQCHEELQAVKFEQFLFYRQWLALKSYCKRKGVGIIGDIPIYVNFDSADVWTHPQIFKLDENLNPKFVAGVPPDYFSETGQRWGNPVYDWPVLKEQNYSWWVERIRHSLELYDMMRIDHFRGFEAYWEIPASESTAVKGEWVKAPGLDFFNTLKEEFKELPIIAEDVGYITLQVKELIRACGFPGMKILQFAFDGSKDNDYLPHRYPEHCVVYTGTHDNNTLRGWFDNEISPQQKEFIFNYCKGEFSKEEAAWRFIELAVASKADTAIFPIQDLFGLSEEARMNTPGTTKGNWLWRLPDNWDDNTARQKLQALMATTERASKAQAVL